jgi:hypothetical protein
MKQHSISYKYQLDEDLTVRASIVGNAARIEADDGTLAWVSLDNDGILSVRKGYMWDGASGPTIDRPAHAVLPASCAHDALYQLMRDRKLPQECREAADLLLYRLLIAGGMWRWRAWLWLKAVRLFAAGSAVPK